MLELIKTKTGKYNVIDSNRKIILPKDYNNIEIQDNGIIARHDIEKTFLDCEYDLFDINGKFLFSQYSHYDGNYVNDYNFYINKDYVTIYFSSTPDYDNYDHDTFNTYSYRHLDGSAFNVPAQDNMQIVTKKGNNYLINTENDSYIYDMKNKKVLFSYSTITNPIEKMVIEINDALNNKIKSLICKNVLYYGMDCLNKYGLNENEKANVRKELLLEIEYFKTHDGLTGMYTLNGYVDKNYYKNTDDYDSNLAKCISDINNKINSTDNLNIECGLCLDVYDNKCYARLFTDNISNNLENEISKIHYNESLWKDEYGKYKNFTMVEITNNGFTFNAKQQNLAILKNGYEKVTGKKSDFDIEKYTKEVNKDFADSNVDCME